MRSLARVPCAERGHMSHVFDELKKTYVFVSCVAMHVRMSSIPVVQSRRPISESSSARGGTLTSSRTSAPAWVALNRRFPPRKQTRKSCFGVSRHELLRKHYVGSRLSKVTEDLHFTVRVRRCVFWNEFCRVGETRLGTLLDKVIMDSLDCVFIHLQTQLTKMKV